MALNTVSYSSTVCTCVYRADLSSVSLCCVTALFVCVGMFRQELLCSDSFTFLRQTAEKELAFVSLVSFS